MREPHGTDERRIGMTRARTIVAILTATGVLGLAACGNDRTDRSIPAAAATTPSTTPAPTPSIALTYRTSGGCEVLGPNCPTYTIWTDGRVEIGRTGAQGTAVLTGHIPVAEVERWASGVATLDASALAAALGPGTCNSCVDGTDIVVTIVRPTDTVVLDSTKLAFEPRNPFFATLERLMTDVRAVGSLPIAASS